MSFNGGLGLGHRSRALWRGYAARPASADLWIDTSGNTTVENDLTVNGALAIVGGETFTGLVTITSATGAGAAGALGPEELQFETTQAATAGATIRNPGYVDWEARTWETTGGTSTVQLFGRFGAVIDTITGATGAPATYRMVWADTAGTIQWSVNQGGLTLQNGDLQFATAGTTTDPNITLSTDTDTGVSFPGGDAFYFITAGVRRGEVTNAGVGIEDGTAAAPSLYFRADTDNGLFRIGANNVGVSTAGATRIDVSATAVNISGASQLLLADGSASAPAVVFSSDTDTGMYSAGANNIGIATGGARRLNISAGTFLIDQNAVGVGADSVTLAIRGQTSAATRDFQIFNEADAGTDTYRLKILDNASAVLMILESSGGVTFGGAAAPSAGNLRLERDEADSWFTCFDTGNTGWSFGLDFSDSRAWLLSEAATVGTNNALRVPVTTRVLQLGGTATDAANPILALTGDTNTGLYWPAADVLGVTTAGAERARFDSTGLGIVTAGSAAASSIYNTADTNTGAFWAAADVFAFTTGGVESLRYNAHSIASAAGATWDGVSAGSQTVTITGSTGITTATGFNFVNIGIPTLSAASALTVTNAAALYLSGPPVGAGAGPATITNAYTLWVDTGSGRFDGRLLEGKGANIASGNDITLGSDGNLFNITGTTQINTISATGWTAGSLIMLYFAGSLTVAHNTAGTGASILLAGAANFSATADDTLMLVFDGTTWREVSRTAI